MKLDRALQRRLLERLALIYPAGFVGFATELNDVSQDVLFANMQYLAEYGLIESGIKPSREIGRGPERWLETARSRITARGMDFLADDGGLGAILGVVTIKLHDDTIKAVITQKIEESDLAPPEKSKLLDQLRELRGESLKHLTMKLLDAGLDNWKEALPVIQKTIEFFS